MFDQTRNAKCFSYDTLIPYPFQKHFRQLKNADVVKACAEGLENLNGTPKEPENFEEFIHQRFGPGITEHIMLPYNLKLWARDLKKMDAKWVGERVAAPEGVKEKFETTGGKRKTITTYY